MKNKAQLRITLNDFLLANRRASRAEEIQAHGKQIRFRQMLQKSKKVYDRNSMKRAGIKSDDGSFFAIKTKDFCNFATGYSYTSNQQCQVRSHTDTC